MLYWLNTHSLSVIRMSFLVGVIGALVLCTFWQWSAVNMLAIGGLVAAGTLGIVLLARITSKLATHYMPSSIKSTPWHQLTQEEFDGMGFPGGLTFVAQLSGLMVASLGVGCVISVMVFSVLLVVTI